MLTRALRGVHLDTIDRRSTIGVALRRTRDELTEQLGGLEEVTPALALLIEQIAIKAVIVQAVGEFILRQESPVEEQRKVLAPVVMQHDGLQRTLAKLLETIGLQRVAKPAETLAEYMRRKDAEKAAQES
jgi:hypothetical protein